MSKKEKIKLFYEQELRKYIEEDYARGISDFKEEYQIGRGCFSSYDETPQLEGSCQLIMVSGTLPINVLKTFYKHFWYAHRCRTSFSLLEIPLEETTTYAFFISGYADDGWDCSGKWVELYDNDSIVGSISIPDIDDPALKGNDFNRYSIPGLLILD
jgi:hypothetical protein